MKWIAVALTCLALTGCGAAEVPSVPNQVASLSTIATSAQAPSTNSYTTNASTFAGQASVQGIIPVRLRIPAIKVDTNVQSVGLLTDGQMGVPTNDTSVAWYKDGTEPGAAGNAVIDGHVDSKSGPAVFFYLKDLNKGDKIYVTDAHGTTYTFAVTDIEAYPRDNAPLARVFGSFGVPNLNLITCTGLFDTVAGTHDERLVVYSTLVSVTNPS